MEAGMWLVRRISYLRPNIWLGKRPISTSSKKKDIVTIAETVIKKKPKVVEGNVAKDDWICYGFNYESEYKDRFVMHIIMFTTITIALVGGSFMMAHIPDMKARDWYRREAFLELHRRERLGLPLVDPDLIERSRILLPTDEELGETDVII